MVLVQSFWSKPFLNADSNEYNYRASGGFLDKRYFYYCWALSYLSLKSFGEKVILFTDNLGKHLLVEALGLEYDEIRLELNAMDNLSSSYWAIPKLHVYKSMKEPFLHIDGDLIIYPGFRDLNLEDKNLVFEFKNESFSDNHLKSIKYLNNILFKDPNSVVNTPRLSNSSDTNLANSKTSFEAIPTESIPEGSFKTEAGELNCGVIGGEDYKFLNEFASCSLDLFNKNLDKLDSEFLKFNKNFINSYFEQYLLYQYICRQGKEFSCIYENNPWDLYQRDFFLPVNNTLKIMTHFILNLKVKFSLEIELTLRLNHPEWYSRINDLIDRNII